MSAVKIKDTRSPAERTHAALAALAASIDGRDRVKRDEPVRLVTEVRT